MEQDKLSLARQIIASPLFQSQSRNQQTDILEQIIATGEVSSEEVMNLYNGNSNNDFAYLESLPYNVFLNVIINGEITGQSLINLCNSSSLINQQCNKPFKVEDTGETIPQYLFLLLLQKLGVDYNQIRQRIPDLSPRDLYFYFTVGDGLSYRRLNDKLVYIDENYINEDWSDIRNLYELLYEDDDGGKPGFLSDMMKMEDSIEFRRFDYASTEIYRAQDSFDDELTSDIEEAARLAGMTSEQLLKRSFDRNIDRAERMKYFLEAFPGVKYTFPHYLVMIRNYTEYFREYLLKLPNISDHSTLYNDIGNIVNNINQHMEEDPDLDVSKLLDKQDIEYLIRLHSRILRRELTINTKFRIFDLI